MKHRYSVKMEINSNLFTFENLKPGQSVDITFKGPIIQAYPPQATGSEVTISNK